MEDAAIAIARTLFSFIILILVTIILGKHINIHKNHYSFALAITIGSFIANMGFNTKLNFGVMLAAFLALILLYYAFLLLASRNRRLRRWFSGQPTVVMENGKILDENMKKIKFSLDDLNQHLRELGVFDIYEVDYALVEASGKLSMRKKDRFQTPTKQELHLQSTTEGVPVELIMDGKIIRKNLTDPYSENWIRSQCQKQNIAVDDVYYAVVNSNGSLFIDTYKDHIHSPADLE